VGRSEETKRLRVAVIGCGKMGMQHIRAIKMQGNADLVAICDSALSEKSLKALFPEAIPFFQDPAEMLTSFNLDIAHICTPPDTHATLAQLAIERGLHVYVEKPFTPTLAEAKFVLSLAEKAGVNVCAGHQLLIEPPARRTNELLNVVGDLVHIESYFSFRQVRRNITTTDQLIDILPHPVYLLLHFLRAGERGSKQEPLIMRSIAVRPEGEVRGVFEIDGKIGTLVVTLRGRPIESYVRIVGTNGSLHLDFVLGTVTKLPGPGTSALSIILNAYSQAKQIFCETTKSVTRLVFTKERSYPGLLELFNRFYASIIRQSPPPISYDSVLETVSACEVIGKELKQAKVESSARAKVQFESAEKDIKVADCQKGTVLITGGTGFLGRRVAFDLRTRGWPVRVIARRIPSYDGRIPGATYVTADLADPIPAEVFEGVKIVVHCAAETAGGKEAHERNTITATKNLLEYAAKAGVKQFIHISSLAVLKPGQNSGSPLDETSPIDHSNLGRGPYVWGKAKAEEITGSVGKRLGVDLKIIRPGPLVDFDSFEPPGRLGREIGRWFVAVGGLRDKLSVCRIQTMSELIRFYLERFEDAPAILNAVEPDPPTRIELVVRLLHTRPDLKVHWIPMIVLTIANPVLKLCQRILLADKKPIDIAAAFSTGRYDTRLVATVLQKARVPLDFIPS